MQVSGKITKRPMAAVRSWQGPSFRNRDGKPTFEGYASQLVVEVMR
jgi:hypothetical protein